MKRRPRILMVAPTGGAYGGIETFTATIAREVIDSGEFDVRVVFRLRPGCVADETLAVGLARHGVPYRLMGKPDAAYLKDLWWSDLVNCHFPLLYATFPARLLGKKLVVTVENQRWPVHRDVYVRALDLAHARWFISSFVAKTWEGETANPRTRIVPAVSALEYGWVDPAGRRGFYFIARWVPEKGLEQLIDAYSSAAIDRAAHPLVLHGDGPLRAEIEARIVRSGAAEFIARPGFVPPAEKSRSLSHARWNAAPAAFNEDLGLSPIEARALGVPSIVSRAGGLPEAAGAEALLCDPGDVATLRTALETAAAMDDAEYRRRALACKESLVTYLPRPGFYRDEFTALLARHPEKKTMDYFKLYQEAIGAALSGTVATTADGAVSSTAGLDALCGLSHAVKAGDRVQYFAGNGASAAFGGHMALDWSKNGGVRSLAITDPPLLSATANDLGAAEMFAGPISWLGREGDLLVSISSSGNSPNVVRAIEAARDRGMRVATFSGLKPTNRSRAMGDVNFYVPAKTYGIVECVHQVILHAWLDRFMDIREWERDEEQNMRLGEFVP